MAEYFNIYTAGLAFNRITNRIITDRTAETQAEPVVNIAPVEDSGKNASKASAVSSNPDANPANNSGSLPPVYEHLLSFDRDNLIRGIIFSEILGPPRGKRRLW